MVKVRRSKMRQKFNYNQDRKKLKKKLIKKNNPRIESEHIRNAWDNKKSLSRNFREMGLTADPNRALPLKKQTLLSKDAETKSPANIVTKPYVLNQLEEEASRPLQVPKTLSSDLIQYAQYMIREHNDDYKAMARDEKNYYQDTPKQIKRKINEYKRFHPEHYSRFVSSLAAPAPAPPLQ
ncbi:nucleolar protein 16 [Betta splendens]|uniref:Nucleolar protein 16 n=1 Tax=Betta splendens TaxID=158456 RepID=A0A6P7PKZ9_BETSP|nr:nucleolar protein 16 [Betta splendens]